MFALQYHRYGGSEVLRVEEVEEPHAGPGQVRVAVRATGVTPADWYLRSGMLRGVLALDFPHIPGVDAAGTVDEVGEGVTGTAVGDEVFGLVPFADQGGAAAQYAVLEAWAPKPRSWSFEEAGGAAGNIDTATRVLEALEAAEGMTLLIEGAAGGVGTITAQLARARGLTVIGTASEGNHGFLEQLGVVPVTYGVGLADRLAPLAPHGVDVVLDAAGKGSLADLVAIAGGPHRVVTIADFDADRHGVRFCRSEAGQSPGRAGLPLAAVLADSGRLTVPLHAVFPLADAATAHDVSASGHARGKIVITVP
ncbi:NADP-dependent oxidoreductase [Streptomyces spectabilis]|uniref:NADP-dependent oxidoreductase n=1 Tax=Streptomyces spectabilis TaxID=68270 RepID=A0A5P2WYU7_STRST|nr:NADP-dependent oxidoreductase [Streptomyces spectabilis]MBB5101151.1 NADPH:quinone reductase-like Zn-dependent oxidoreductase [Streptomyces spectabilis]MCI3900355.1 NADP-dependent oxidoreductase [Streptomyces spectabilis]QEV57943.1 NADP-dependent oxidoreductase [Streptomyces spectabilis]GGV09658.1 oxidoreductase [Streptomyces spectabilis]